MDVRRSLGALFLSLSFLFLLALLRRRRRKNQIRAPMRARPARAPITMPAMAPPDGEEDSELSELLALVSVAFESSSLVVESDEDEEEEDEPDDDDDDESEPRALSVSSHVESHFAAAVAAPTVVSESKGIAWTLASW